MESLPPVVWRQIATKDDLEALAKELRVEFDAFKSEVRGELMEFRGELKEMRGELKEFHGELMAFKGEVRGELKEMRGEFALQLARTTRILVFTFLGISITMMGAMVAIVQTAPTA